MNIGILGVAGCNETTAASGPWEMQLPQAPVISIDRTRVLSYPVILNDVRGARTRSCT